MLLSLTVLALATLALGLKDKTLLVVGHHLFADETLLFANFGLRGDHSAAATALVLDRLNKLQINQLFVC